MKKRILFIVYLSILQVFVKYSFAQTINWVGMVNSSGNAFPDAKMVIDNNGNIYLVGWFSGTADLDPSPNTFNLTANGLSNDIFLAKYDTNGTLVWAFSMGGGNSPDYLYSMEIDANNNLYIAGFIESSVDFDPSPSNTVNLSAGGFIAKYNSNGALIWAKTIETKVIGADRSNIQAKAMNIKDNYLYLGGSILGTVDFDPNPSEVLLSNNITWTIRDAFFAKYDLDGNLLFAKQLASTQSVYSSPASYSEISQITVDENQNIYVAGALNLRPVDFDPGIGTFVMQGSGSAILPSSIFFGKYDNNGNLVWVNMIDGDGNEDIRGISLSTTGQVYICGMFTSNNLDFDPSNNSYSLNAGGIGRNDMFLAKYDNGGNFIWAKQLGDMGGSNIELLLTMEIGLDGSLYLGGGLLDANSDLDPSAGMLTFSYLSNNAFIGKYTSEGNVIWVRTIGGSGAVVRKIAVSSSEDIYFTVGLYDTGAVLFDACPSSLSSSNFKNTLLGKYSLQAPNRIVTTSETFGGDYNQLTIKNGGKLTMNCDLRITGNIIIESGGSLETNQYTISGSGNFDLQAGSSLIIGSNAGITLSGNSGAVQVSGTRTYHTEANYEYKGTASQQTGNGLPATIPNLVVNNTNGVQLTNNLGVKNLVHIKNGFLQSNGKLTLLSTANYTAMVFNENGNVQGNVIVQRFVKYDPTATFPVTPTAGAGYHYFSSPISNGKVSEFADDISLVLNSTYDFVVPYTGAFPTFYRYNESKVGNTSPNDVFEKGWESPANDTEALVRGKGYIAHLPTGATVDMTGTLNSGNIFLAVSRGTGQNAGWNLIGNPYPSPLKISSFLTTNGSKLENQAIYRRIPIAPYAGQWATYINGIGVNGGNQDIATMQGFFVRAKNNNSLTFNNAMRPTTYQETTFFRTEDENNVKLGLLRLYLSGNEGTDETVVYFQAGATPHFDGEFDAYKVQLNGGNTPSIFTQAENINLSINGLAEVDTTLMLPLQLYINKAGNYTISTKEMLYFPADVSIYLVDKELNIEQDLRTKANYVFSSATGAISKRFALLFKKAPVSLVAEESIAIYPNPAHEQITIHFKNTKLEYQSIKLYDLTGKLMAIYENLVKKYQIDLSAYQKGMYFLEIEGVNNKVVKKVVKQ